ncbi:methylase of chemotaxis methyl-accepting protein [Methylocaldum marinum]|uniref:Methylase of chemotaxis methyl-accepting protein n=1 Tax=Methylocaldum marinum TaxID=1432792 RepID=A0A250L100_9GAMM|nr:chemotaxis protein CheB [Methylocaldum marinum]BBA35729.1 methylase of chemotaxis methyl-accepting protein [Methylocaldum marinum]
MSSGSENLALELDSSRSTEQIPIMVGIGASAGGLNSLQNLFQAIEPGIGFAFLLAQHLSPDHDSKFPEILANSIRLPVIEGREGMAIKPDHIYVMPPDADISVSVGHLCLKRRRVPLQPHRPADHLFLSLARELGKKAIGIVLSGTGSDGAKGLKAIKTGGGIAFAEDPSSARFDGMPRNAISMGCVDYVLPPREIARELSNLSQRAENGADGPESVAIREKDLKQVFRVVLATCGLDFSQYKRKTILRRLLRRMALNKIHSLSDYLTLLQKQPAEVEALCQDFLIRVTTFFRDPETFRGLTREVFPRLLKDRSANGPLRIWVPGCATGEEAYSIAMGLVEFLDEQQASVPIQVFGSDINPQAISLARAGRYSESIRFHISEQRLRRFFNRIDGYYHVIPAIREACVFAEHNVAHDPPFSKLDLISCCNLLIYLDPDLQRQVLSTFHYALNPGKFLALGPSENIGPQGSRLFEPISKNWSIYVRKNIPGRMLSDFGGQEQKIPQPAKTLSETAASLQDPGLVQRQADNILLARYVPAGVLVDGDLNVLQFRGHTGLFLEHQQGSASLNLKSLTQTYLFIELSEAIQETRSTGQAAKRQNIRIRIDGRERHIQFEVLPLSDAEGAEQFFLILFEDSPSPVPTTIAADWFGRLSWVLARQIGPGFKSTLTEERLRLQALRRELEATGRHLQSVIDARNACQEKMSLLEQELVYARQEFQSTNEELETAKQELQSANEELATANEALRVRNHELSQVNLTLKTARDFNEAILGTMRDALVVLDRDLRVKRANRAYFEMFRTGPETIHNNCLCDTGSGLWDRREIKESLQLVAQGGRTLEDYEIVQTHPEIGERILNLSAYKLLGEDHLNDLILLTIQDVTERRGIEAALRQRSETLDQAHEAVLMWELGGTVRYWNRGAEELYGYKRSEALGQVSHDLLKTERGISSEEFERILARDRHWVGEVVHTTRTGKRIMVDSRNTVVAQRNRPPLVLETNRDITERKEIEESLREAHRQKDEFLAMLAHELRNPLAPVRNGLHILRTAGPDKAPVKQIHAMMDRQLTKLTRIVDDLLDVARITRGQIELREEVIDLVPLIVHVLEIVRLQLDSRKHKLALDLPGRPLFVKVDPTRMEQIVENLLANAAKYTPPGGHIEVMLQIENDEAVLRIRDDGRGIGPEDLPHIFDLFVQADRSLDRMEGGLGIGLTLVRRLVELHHGRVEARSAGLGRGSEFVVYLPLWRGADHDPQDIGVLQSEMVLVPRKVLVVDDNHDAAESTALIVNTAGHTVEVAYDGPMALNVAAKFKPEVVLLDIGLPGMDGYELAKRLRSLPDMEKALLVAISGYGTEDDRRTSEQAGLDYHLVKPVDPDALSRLLATAAESA